MAGGILQVELGNKSPEQISAEDEAKKSADISDALGNVLNGRFIEYRDARLDKENEWLEAMLAYNGQYNPTQLQQIGPNRSKVFVHLTRTKTLAAYSRIIDLMLGHGDHWSIDPTPEPELSAEDMKAIHGMAEQAMPGVDPDGDEIEKIAQVLAAEASKKMSRRISDQLVETRYEHAFKLCTFEMCLLGTGVLKGPVIKVSRSQKWGRVDGKFDLVESEKIVPGIEAPSIWDTYSDPYATSTEDCIGIFERHVITAQMMRDLVGPGTGFDAVAIEQIISEQPGGNHEEFMHETERRRIAGVNNTTALNVRYDLMEYWGQVRGSELAAAGMTIAAEDLEQEFQANVWFCGRRTIKVQLNPLRPERLPYQIIPYERQPNSLHGIGVPFQMKDSQSVINASVRATLDNMGIASGPQVEVNMAMLAAGEDPRSMYPWKVWLRDGNDPSTPMLRFYQPENISAGLMNITEQFRAFADEETSMPSYTHGEQTPALNSTASGMSMLMGAANVALKSIIKNIDAYGVEPLITGLYNWNMEWSVDDEIKGDMKVSAKGSTALLAKEIQSQRLIQYANITNNPTDIALMGPVKRAGMLRAIATSMDLDPDEVAPDDPKNAPAQPPAAQPMMPGATAQPAVTVPSAPPAAMAAQPGQPANG